VACKTWRSYWFKLAGCAKAEKVLMITTGYIPRWFPYMLTLVFVVKSVANKVGPCLALAQAN
jgi:hypothetical protein